jgi:hypothetical protein
VGTVSIAIGSVAISLSCGPYPFELLLLPPVASVAFVESTPLELHLFCAGIVATRSGSGCLPLIVPSLPSSIDVAGLPYFVLDLFALAVSFLVSFLL